MIQVAVMFDQTAVQRASHRLLNYQGSLLNRRIEKALREETKPLVGLIKGSLHSSGVVRRTGNLERSIKLTKARKRYGEAAGVTVGPRAPHRHLIIRGHRIVTRGGRDTGQRARAFNFVGPVVERTTPLILRRVADKVWAG